MLLPGQPDYSAPPVDTPQWELQPSQQTRLAVELNVVKDFINRPREDTFFDAELAAFVLTAQRAIETMCQMVLVPSIWVGSFPCFYPQMRIEKRPYIAVDKIEYVAPETGTITEVEAGTFHAGKIAQKCGMVFLGEGKSWPTPANRFDAVRITARAGLEQMPEDVLQALLMTVASLDRNRGDESQGGGGSNVTVYAMKNARGASGVVPPAARVLLADYIWRVI